MKQHDRENLRFLLNTNEKSFKAWYDQADDDDIQYAFELIQEYKSELDELEMEYMMEDNDLSEAKTILEKFKL